MGLASVIIKTMDFVIMCCEWEIDNIKEEFDGAKTIYNTTGDELTIPAHATEEMVPGDEHEECYLWKFNNIEVYVEFF